MFIVITSENEIPNEIDLLREMIEFPITLHVRKPTFNKEKTKEWLQKFEENQHKKMMLHQHHELIEHFDLKGLHFKETHRKETKINKKIEFYRLKDKTLSASFHLQNEAESQNLFDYALLSPVFNSISKNNYQGKDFHLKNPLKPIIALGGITQNNLEKTKKYGFSGVAVLGSIWQSSKPLESFKNLYYQYLNIFQ
ncbi:thiamine phosphate synthase [Ornithobacterium rhinotracheale]|uniref:thiamine phosphate synthase n=1 Tax=Ornithobacterium rhinotracheale TaxID=28251 RepID=UPI004035686A